MSESGKAPKTLTKAQLAAAFEVSLPTIDSWLRKGCPYQSKGGHGRPWRFSLPKVIRWRERMAAESAQEWKGGHVRASHTRGSTPEILQQRPDYDNALRFFTEQAVLHFLWWWGEGDLARVVSGHLHKEQGLSRLKTFESMQLIGFTLFQGATDWVAQDAFSKDVLSADGSDIDEVWRAISGRSVSTSPPPDPDAVKFQVPEWLVMKADEYIAKHWPDEATA